MRSASQSASGVRVLLVEDEALIALDVKDMLARLGCVVIGPAPRVAEALELLEREGPELAILDVNLGRERVTPVAEALRERGIPFVLATAYGRCHLPEESLREVPLLPKPIDPCLLQSALADLTEGAAYPRASSSCRDRPDAPPPPPDCRSVLRSHDHRSL